MLDFASSRSLFIVTQTPWNKSNICQCCSDLIFTLTASMMFLVATTETPLSATPWYVERESYSWKVRVRHLLYVAEHHLLAGGLQLLDQADQQVSGAFRPPEFIRSSIENLSSWIKPICQLSIFTGFCFHPHLLLSSLSSPLSSNISQILNKSPSTRTSSDKGLSSVDIRCCLHHCGYHNKNTITDGEWR